MANPEEEKTDQINNLEVKNGLLLGIQYLIELKLGLTELPKEEWLAQVLASQKQ